MGFPAHKHGDGKELVEARHEGEPVARRNNALAKHVHPPVKRRGGGHGQEELQQLDKVEEEVKVPGHRRLGTTKRTTPG